MSSSAKAGRGSNGEHEGINSRLKRRAKCYDSCANLYESIIASSQTSSCEKIASS